MYIYIYIYIYYTYISPQLYAHLVGGIAALSERERKPLFMYIDMNRYVCMDR